MINFHTKFTLRAENGQEVLVFLTIHAHLIMLFTKNPFWHIFMINFHTKFTLRAENGQEAIMRIFRRQGPLLFHPAGGSVRARHGRTALSG
ncbi:hypothetical protein GM30_24085 [Trabulsiella odontotermitis]|nr:hypothetical protein GM30_24085 [Trabulsiella odontotermitis]